MQIPAFPKLTDEQMKQMLEPPSGKLRVVIDSDAKNEIDDQWAITWALLSQDQLEIEGLYAAPFSFQHHRAPLLQAYEKLQDGGGKDDGNVVYAGSYHDWAKRLQQAGTDPYALPFPDPSEGMELSYQEILKIYDLLEIDPSGQVFRGSPSYLKNADAPCQSEAAQHLIERALANDNRPLYVVAIGAVTNVACALLMEPKIVERIVVVWTSAYPTFCRQSNLPSLNLMQDLPASRLIFDSGVPHVYLPGFYIGEQLKISLPEMERWVKGRGAIGDYLHYLYTHNPIHRQRGITDHFSRTWIMWDLIAIAWLLNSDWVAAKLTRSPILDDNYFWVHDDSRHLMREAIAIDRDAIFRDFIQKLPLTR